MEGAGGREVSISLINIVATVCAMATFAGLVGCRLCKKWLMVTHIPLESFLPFSFTSRECCVVLVCVGTCACVFVGVWAGSVVFWFVSVSDS